MATFSWILLLPWHRIVDYVVLTCALYAILWWAQKARATRMAIATLGLYLTALAARRFDLMITSWVLVIAAVLLGLSILVAFQSELRSALMRLDTVFGARASAVLHTDKILAQAAFELAS